MSKINNDDFKKFSKMLSVILHEIKTPMVSISSNVEFLQDVTKADNDDVDTKLISHVSSIIAKSVEMGQQQINMALKLSEIGQGISQEKKKLSLKKYLEQALSKYSFEYRSKEKLKVDIKNDIEFLGDAENIKHVIFNLLKNSYIHNGFDVEVKIVVEGNKLIYKDNGSGIDKGKIANIFDSFYTTSPKGIGIGLTFCKEVLESWGAKINCESKEGEYTRFIIEFPTKIKE